MINGDNYIIDRSKHKRAYEVEIIKIKLINGVSVRLPKNQVVLTSRSGISAEKLKVGDKVSVDYTPIPSYNPDISDIYLYNKGIILGCFKAKNSILNKELLKVKIDSKLDDLRYLIQNAIRSYHTEFKIKKVDDYYIGITDNEDKIKHLLLDTKFENFNLSKLNKNSKIGFIATYFTINGIITNSDWIIANDTDKSLLYDIQRVLIEFGIYSEVELYKKAETYINLNGEVKETKDEYRITIYDISFKKIGFLDHNMEEKLNKIKPDIIDVIKLRKKEQEVVKITEDGTDMIYKLDIKGINHYNTNGLVVLNKQEE